MMSERKEISRDIHKLEQLYDSRRFIKIYIMGNKDLNTAVNNNYRTVQSETHITLLSINRDDKLIRYSFNVSSNITNNQKQNTDILRRKQYILRYYSLVGQNSKHNKFPDSEYRCQYQDRAD